MVFSPFNFKRKRWDMGLFEALGEVSGRIGRLLAEDDFPLGIEPEALRAAVRSYPLRGGKRLRPALLLWSCGALGGDPEKALHAAAAVEVYHNWTLVHDDIIDEDLTRRGQPSTHAELTAHAAAALGQGGRAAAKYGVDFAILAGDLQQAWANRLLLKAAQDGVDAALVLALAAELQDKVGRELISGEALDVEFPYRGLRAVGSDELRRMLYLKTGALLSFCAEAGGKLAVGKPEGDARTVALAEFAAAAGVAFQLRDDWLGVYGTAKLGKPICSDIRSAKPTLLLLKALERLGFEGRGRLTSYLGAASFTEGQIAEIRSLITASGAEAEILAETEGLAAQARTALGRLPDNGHSRLLLELNDYLVSRDY